jgi:hypothetical protein
VTSMTFYNGSVQLHWTSACRSCFWLSYICGHCLQRNEMSWRTWRIATQVHATQIVHVLCECVLTFKTRSRRNTFIHQTTAILCVISSVCCERARCKLITFAIQPCLN